MSKGKPDERTRQELLEQIRQLEEKARELQEGATKPGGKTEGLAEGIVAALGKAVPGLGELIQTASQMPKLHERFAAIDKEVRRRLKEQPLGGASSGIAGSVSRRQRCIPPTVRRGGAVRPASAGEPLGEAADPGHHRPSRGPQFHISPETPAELPVDIFDEGHQIVLLAEAPGLNQEDITVSVEGAVLLISVEAAHRRSLQQIELPCAVVGLPETSLANGILRIQVRKGSKP